MSNNLPRHVMSILCALLIGASDVRAQFFDVDTLLYHGDPDKFINLVFLGDGYHNTEIESYLEDAQTTSEYLFSISPFSEYKNYFNVFAIKVPSLESGTDHPATATDVTEPVFPAATVNSYFNSTFDFAGIHRLLVPQDWQAINSVLINNLPRYDQVMVLVNSAEYGGSGGSNATSSVHTSASEILAHEIGHSFGRLSDEYYAGDGYAGESPNMSSETDPSRVRWKNWIGTDGVGIYQHCCEGNSSMWYRPHQSCKMRALGLPFCPVCKETIVERIHAFFGTPILSRAPAQSNVAYCAEPMQFGITLIHPVPNTIKVTWTLNDSVVAMNIDSIQLTELLLDTGSNTLIAECLDTTWLTRSDQHPSIHTYSATWTIRYEPLSPPTITADDDTVICQGDFVFLTSSTSSAYLWNHGATTQSVRISESGSYAVTVTDANGCTASSLPVTIVVNPSPPTPVITANDSVLTSSADTGNQWFLNEELIPGATGQEFILLESGTYTVVVTDSAGCMSVSEPYDFETSGLDNPVETETVIIIPNPNNGKFLLQGDQISFLQIDIFNVFGTLILEVENPWHEIDLSDQPRGIYVLIARSPNQLSSGRIVIQ